MNVNERLFLWRAQKAAMASEFGALARDPDRPWPDSKHWDLEARLPIAYAHVKKLGLRSGPPLRVLDLGTGNGYFPFLCNLLGHEAIGLDQGDWELGASVCGALGVPRVVHDIVAYAPLPDLGRPFDLITALLLWFNTREAPAETQSETWGADEWGFFLDDLRTHLAPDGRIYLTLGNVTAAGPLNPEAEAFLRGKGAEIDRTTIQLRCADLA